MPIDPQLAHHSSRTALARAKPTQGAPCLPPSTPGCHPSVSPGRTPASVSEVLNRKIRIGVRLRRRPSRRHNRSAAFAAVQIIAPSASVYTGHHTLGGQKIGPSTPGDQQPKGSVRQGRLTGAPSHILISRRLRNLVLAFPVRPSRTSVTYKIALKHLFAA